MRNAEQTEVEMLAIDLGVDESQNGLLCPFCQGGRSGERTFSITRISDGVLHNCWRASCEAGRGFVPTVGILRDPAKPRDPKPDKHYTGQYLPLEKSDRNYFLERFDLDVHPHGPIGVTDRNEHVLQVLNPLGMARGYAVRRGGWQGTPATPRSWRADGPKTRIFMNDSQQIPQSWQQNHGFAVRRPVRRVVLVEDGLSALKIQQNGDTGVALLGTHLEATKVREISMQKPTEVIIALDNDATAQALRMAGTWGLAFPRTRVAVLERDLKDVSRDEVRRILE